MSVAVYRGRFGAKQAERLLWRAGFGPAPGQAKQLARKGMTQRRALADPAEGQARLRGPAPHDEDGLPLAPGDAWGHDMLWWLDRMVRTNQPLVERMALTWHDWFATADVGQTQLNLDQNDLFRRQSMGSFAKLLEAVTRDPAMLVWLSGNQNNKWSPNENYARELMELFTLGADAGYSEDDVREQARALTGWTNDWDEVRGMVDFRFEPEYHDGGSKRIFGKAGDHDWQDSCRLCLEHPAHAEYFVRRLWSYFIPTKPSAEEGARASAPSTSRAATPIRPVVEAILMHPSLLRGPAHGQAADRADRRDAPGAAAAASTRRPGRGSPATRVSACSIRRTSPAGTRSAGSTPPGSAGAGRPPPTGDRGREVDEDGYDPRRRPSRRSRRALGFWGKPTLTKATEAELMRFSNQVERIATEEWQQRSYRALRQNALRMLIATSPDFHDRMNAHATAHTAAAASTPAPSSPAARSPRPARDCRRSRRACPHLRARAFRAAPSCSAAAGSR